MELEQSILVDLNKWFGSRFCVGSQGRRETPEEGRRTHQPKHWEYKNENEDNSLNTLSDKKTRGMCQK